MKKKAKKPFYKCWWFWLLVFIFAVVQPTVFVPVLCIVVLLAAALAIYVFAYFHGNKFNDLKMRISTYITDCNDLNRHIEELKNTHVGINRLDAGTAEYTDSSAWNYKRPELKNQQYAPNVYNCSRTVCDSAKKEPFKYICKYFNIPIEETSLETFETVLNNFEAAEEGKAALQGEKENIISSIANDVPFLIRKLCPAKLERSLGFEPVDLTDAHFPRYTFKYVSSGGNASTRCDIIMNIHNLNAFVEYLSQKVKFKKSAAGQRALMTSKLREQIKIRDNYTCKQCGISTEQEPHLLLEIDHIIPVSKGGLTAEDNLQTLCWRCNRKKGAKTS